MNPKTLRRVIMTQRNMWKLRLLLLFVVLFLCACQVLTCKDDKQSESKPVVEITTDSEVVKEKAP